MTDKVREALEAAREAFRQINAEMNAGFGSSFGETMEQLRRAAAKIDAALAALDAPAEGEALSAQEAEIERLRKEQQAKDAVYWATAEQCANLETDLTQMRKERDEAADSCNNLILELSKSGASLSEENNLRMSAEAEVARLRKVVDELRDASESFLPLAEEGSQLHKAHRAALQTKEQTNG